MDKIDFNKKMIGKHVFLCNHKPTLRAEVVDVIDADSFLVKLTCGQLLTVSIYDVRSVEDSAIQQLTRSAEPCDVKEKGKEKEEVGQG